METRQFEPIVEMRDVGLRYGDNPEVLKNINFSFRRGSMHFLTGKSGAGKTSLLSMLYLAQRPTAGTLKVFGNNVALTGRDTLAFLRRRIGVVFQDFRLLKNKTVYENIEFAQQIIGMNKREIARNVAIMLEMVGLKGKENAYPGELSGGEQQRVAIARALINNPAILLADEPTGNLDPQMAWEIMMLLQEINKMGTTVVVVTHNNDVVDIMKKRVVTLDNGSIVSDEQEGGYQYERD